LKGSGRKTKFLVMSTRIAVARSITIALWIAVCTDLVADDFLQNHHEEIRRQQLDIKVDENNHKHASRDPFLSLLNSLSIFSNGGPLKDETSEPGVRAGIFDESHWDESTYE